MEKLEVSIVFVFFMVHAQIEVHPFFSHVKVRVGGDARFSLCGGQ